MKRFSFPFAYKPKLDLRNTIIYSGIFKQKLFSFLKEKYKCFEIDPILVADNVNSVISHYLGDRLISFDNKSNNNICCLNSTQDNYLSILGQTFKNENLIMFAPVIKRDAAQTNLDSIFSNVIKMELSIPIELTNDYINNLLIDIYNQVVDVANDKQLTNIYKIRRNKINKNKIKISTAQQIEDAYPTLPLQLAFTHFCSENEFVIVSNCCKKTTSGSRVSSFIPTAYDEDVSFCLNVFDSSNNKPVELIHFARRPSGDKAKKQINVEYPFELVNDLYDHKIYDQNNQYGVSITINITNLLFYFLEKIHLAEVIKSVWPKEFRNFVKKEKIQIF